MQLGANCTVNKLQAESDILPGEVTKYLMVFSHHVEGEIN
jgi:hypothetical protein